MAGRKLPVRDTYFGLWSCANGNAIHSFPRCVWDCDCDVPACFCQPHHERF
jgi:hypothetical protein